MTGEIPQSLDQVDDAADASYNPAADWTADQRSKRSPAPPPKVAAAEAKRKRNDRWRAMDAPELRGQFCMLRNKARRVTNPGQRQAIEGQLAEMEYWLALKDAERPEPIDLPALEQPQPTRSSSSRRRAPPLTSSPPGAGQAALETVQAGALGGIMVRGRASIGRSPLRTPSASPRRSACASIARVPSAATRAGVGPGGAAHAAAAGDALARLRARQRPRRAA